MLLQCSNCGAPLDAREGTRVITCRYCNRMNRVQSMTTIAPQTPQGWAPPPTWTPPPGFHASSGPLAYHNPAPRILAFVVPIFVAVIGLIGAGAASFGNSRAGSSVAWTPQGRADAWDGKSTLVCNGTDAMTVSNKTANVPGTTAIVANGMCKMTLTNVRAHGETGLVANGGVHVIVNGGAISGTTNSVIANGGAVVELRGGAKIEGSVVENGGARIVR